VSFAKGCLGCVGLVAVGFVGLAVLGNVVGGGKKTTAAAAARAGSPSRSVTVTPTKSQESEITWVTAPELIALYQRNEVAADRMLKGSKIAVKGTIDKVGKDFLGDPYITLKDSEEYSIRSVQAFFGRDDEAMLAELAPGQRVIVFGKVNGLMMNVLLKDCKMVEESQLADRHRKPKR
jgi:hypothetical protein